MSTAPLYISFPSHYHELNPLRSTLHTSPQARKAFPTSEHHTTIPLPPNQTPHTQPNPHLNGRHPQHGAMRRLLPRLHLPSWHLQFHRRLPVDVRALGLHHHFRIRGLHSFFRS